MKKVAFFVYYLSSLEQFKKINETYLEFDVQL